MAAAPRRDRLERLTNLMLVLLDTERPLSLREITEEVEGYPEGKEAARQAFERDKRALRDLGVPVENVPLSSEEQVGYRIRREDYFLPELELDEAEAKALAFAVAAVQLGGNAARDALGALGHPDGSRLGVPIAVLPALPALGVIHEALRNEARVEFTYHGRRRQVDPYGLAFREAAWYLVGRDNTAEGGSGAVRTFRVDRIEDEPEMAEAATAPRQAEFDLGSAINLLPFGGGDGADLPLAAVRVDGRMAREVAARVPSSVATTWDESGELSLLLPVADEAAFVSWVAGLGDTAVVDSPPELRHAVLERMEEMSLPPSGEPHDLAPPEQAEPPQTPGLRTPPPPLVAGERLRRLLAILVHLARVGEAEISDIGARFDMTDEEVVHDLELAACCGVPPYTPDQLIELVVDGDRVTAYGLGHLAKPRRLTPEEGFALAAAAKALAEVPGARDEDALGSALSKLETALGASRLSLEVGQPVHLRALQEAAAAHERIEIVYFSSAASAPSTRQVDPYQVVFREGRWYLDGWCHLVDGERRFQVDRVQSVRRLGQFFEPPETLDRALSGSDAFIGGPDTVRARLAVPKGSELGVERFALTAFDELPDGRLSTEVLVGDADGWLGRLLLRLGPGAEVLAPAALRDTGRNAARRARERYDERAASR